MSSSYTDFETAMKTKLEDCTKHGQCSNCGGCCIPWLPITKEEERTIRKYITKNNIKAIPTKEGKNVYMDCCFHDRKNKRCIIYPVRPDVCRKFKCNLSAKEIADNKDYYNKTCFYNKVDLKAGKYKALKNFKPMDLLFYNDVTCLFGYIVSALKIKSEKDLITFLINSGNRDVAKAIKENKIELEWGEK